MRAFPRLVFLLETTFNVSGRREGPILFFFDFSGLFSRHSLSLLRPCGFPLGFFGIPFLDWMIVSPQIGLR